MPRAGNKIHIPLDPDTAISLLLRVKPSPAMPRPGSHRRKSVWAEVEEENRRPGKARPRKPALRLSH